MFYIRKVSPQYVSANAFVNGPFGGSSMGIPGIEMIFYLHYEVFDEVSMMMSEKNSYRMHHICKVFLQYVCAYGFVNCLYVGNSMDIPGIERPFYPQNVFFDDI